MTSRSSYLSYVFLLLAVLATTIVSVRAQEFDFTDDEVRAAWAATHSPRVYFESYEHHTRISSEQFRELLVEVSPRTLPWILCGLPPERRQHAIRYMQMHAPRDRVINAVRTWLGAEIFRNTREPASWPFPELADLVMEYRTHNSDLADFTRRLVRSDLSAHATQAARAILPRVLAEHPFDVPGEPTAIDLLTHFGSNNDAVVRAALEALRRLGPRRAEGIIAQRLTSLNASSRTGLTLQDRNLVSAANHYLSNPEVRRQIIRLSQDPTTVMPLGELAYDAIHTRNLFNTLIAGSQYPDIRTEIIRLVTESDGAILRVLDLDQLRGMVMIPEVRTFIIRDIRNPNASQHRSRSGESVRWRPAFVRALASQTELPEVREVLVGTDVYVGAIADRDTAVRLAASRVASESVADPQMRRALIMRLSDHHKDVRHDAWTAVLRESHRFPEFQTEVTARVTFATDRGRGPYRARDVGDFPTDLTVDVLSRWPHDSLVTLWNRFETHFQRPEMRRSPLYSVLDEILGRVASRRSDFFEHLMTRTSGDAPRYAQEISQRVVGRALVGLAAAQAPQAEQTTTTYRQSAQQRARTSEVAATDTVRSEIVRLSREAHDPEARALFQRYVQGALNSDASPPVVADCNARPGTAAWLRSLAQRVFRGQQR